MSIHSAIVRLTGSNARLLVADHHPSIGGCACISSSIDGPLAAIRWGRRLLFLTLFISCMIVLNLWHLPITLPFLGAVISLIATALCVVKEEDLPPL